jgi:hypothetical protein
MLRGRFFIPLGMLLALIAVQTPLPTVRGNP